MDHHDIEKLRKVWALTDTTHKGERDAACSRAEALLKKHNKTLRDLPDLLGGGQQASAKYGTNQDYEGAAHRAKAAEAAARAAEQATRRAEEEEVWAAMRARRRAEAEMFRAQIIQKYGSLAAARAPTALEQAVERVSAPFASAPSSPSWHRQKTLAGWTFDSTAPLPDAVRLAIEAAIPVPLTLRASKREYDNWTERNQELQNILESDQDELSLACQLRWSFVRGLLASGLRAQSVVDLIARQEFLMNQNEDDAYETIQAILLDLQHLAPLEGLAPVQFGQGRTTSERRLEVIRLLSNMDTALLNDREIARRVGVSATTVGNLRRKRVTGPMRVRGAERCGH